MRLDREEIERRDFDRTMRGYDADQVNAHLHRIAVAVSDFLDRLGDSNEELPPAVRERLQAMVDATKIEGEIAGGRAREAAERTLDEARRDAERTVEEAREAADRIRADAERERAVRVRDAADELSRILDEELGSRRPRRRFERTGSRSIASP
jgi:DivIVA domain-containing protein